MDPNEIVSERWTNADGTTTIGPNNNDPVYGHLVTYKDGRVVLTRYRRGTGNPAAGVPDQQDGSPETLPPDKTVKEAWDAAQKQAQTQTDQSERRVTRTYTGTDPTTGKPATVTEYESGPPKYDEIKPGTNVAQPPKEEVDPSDPTKTRVWDPSLNGGQGGWKPGVTVAPKPSTGAGTIVPRPDGTYIVRPDGSTVKTDLPGVPGPSSTTQTKLDDGSVVVIRVDADGNVTTTEAVKAPTTTPVPASATGWNPDPSKPDMGVGARRQQIAGMLESGVFGPPEDPKSQEKANALLKQDYDHATLVSQNLGNAATTEGTIYQGGITQRGQDTSTANNRLQAATNTFNTTMGEIFKGAGKAKSGATVTAALMEILNNYRLFTEQFGGLKDHERIEPGPNMARTGPAFQPVGAAAPAPVAPRDDSTAAANPVGFGPVPANVTEPPAMPLVFTPPPTGAPGGPGWGSMADQAQQARMLVGADPLAPTPPPVAGAIDPNQASQAQAMVGPRAPVTGGTLAWSRELGFSPEAINAFIAMEGGQAA